MAAASKGSTSPTSAVTAEYVLQIFAGLENGDGAGFFRHVADDVDWAVTGTHPLAGHYSSKAAFITGTFENTMFARLFQENPIT